MFQKSCLFACVLLIVSSASLFACSDEGGGGEPPVVPGLQVSDFKKFPSKAAFARYLEDLQQAQDAVYASGSDDYSGGDGTLAEASEAASDAGDSPAGSAPDSITNNQEAGVDEGGIVKVHGDHFVILRRGRLFSVRTLSGDDEEELKPISVADAYPSGSQEGTWYDELLIHENRIVVIGYSYQRSATEIGLFDIDDAGKITHRGTSFLRSWDYYSSRNYASRLVGDKLIFYMPSTLSVRESPIETEENLLAVQDYETKTSDSEREDDWQGIVQATDIFQPVQATIAPVLHAVVQCDLSKEAIDCSAQGVLGPWSRSFYVTSEAVYLWVASSRPFMIHEEEDMDRVSREALVYRLPLDGADPTAILLEGSPVDQFSFKAEEKEGGHFNLFLQDNGTGDGMWDGERNGGSFALLRVPMKDFASKIQAMPRKHIKCFPLFLVLAFKTAS